MSTYLEPTYSSVFPSHPPHHFSLPASKSLPSLSSKYPNYISTDYDKKQHLHKIQIEEEKMKIDSYSRKPFKISSRIRSKTEDIFFDPEYQFPVMGPGVGMKSLSNYVRSDLRDTERYLCGPFFLSQKKLSSVASGLNVQEWCKQIFQTLLSDWPQLKFYIKFTETNEFVIQFEDDMYSALLPLYGVLLKYMQRFASHGLGATYGLKKRGDRWNVLEIKEESINPSTNRITNPSEEPMKPSVISPHGSLPPAAIIESHSNDIIPKTSSTSKSSMIHSFQPQLNPMPLSITIPVSKIQSKEIGLVGLTPVARDDNPVRNTSQRSSSRDRKQDPMDDPLTMGTSQDQTGRRKSLRGVNTLSMSSPGRHQKDKLSNSNGVEQMMAGISHHNFISSKNLWDNVISPQSVYRKGVNEVAVDTVDPLKVPTNPSKFSLDRPSRPMDGPIQAVDHVNSSDSFVSAIHSNIPLPSPHPSKAVALSSSVATIRKSFRIEPSGSVPSQSTEVGNTSPTPVKLLTFSFYAPWLNMGQLHIHRKYSQQHRVTANQYGHEYKSKYHIQLKANETSQMDHHHHHLAPLHMMPIEGKTREKVKLIDLQQRNDLLKFAKYGANARQRDELFQTVRLISDRQRSQEDYPLLQSNGGSKDLLGVSQEDTMNGTTPPLGGGGRSGSVLVDALPNNEASSTVDGMNPLESSTSRLLLGTKSRSTSSKVSANEMFIRRRSSFLITRSSASLTPSAFIAAYTIAPSTPTNATTILPMQGTTTTTGSPSLGGMITNQVNAAATSQRRSSLVNFEDIENLRMD